MRKNQYQEDPSKINSNMNMNLNFHEDDKSESTKLKKKKKKRNSKIKDNNELIDVSNGKDDKFNLYGIGNKKYALIHKECTTTWKPQDEANSKKSKTKKSQPIICPCCNADKDSDVSFGN